MAMSEISSPRDQPNPADASSPHVLDASEFREVQIEVEQALSTLVKAIANEPVDGYLPQCVAESSLAVQLGTIFKHFVASDSMHSVDAMGLLVRVNKVMPSPELGALARDAIHSWARELVALDKSAQLADCNAEDGDKPTARDVFLSRYDRASSLLTDTLKLAWHTPHGDGFFRGNDGHLQTVKLLGSLTESTVMTVSPDSVFEATLSPSIAAVAIHLSKSAALMQDNTHGTRIRKVNCASLLKQLYESNSPTSGLQLELTVSRNKLDWPKYSAQFLESFGAIEHNTDSPAAMIAAGELLRQIYKHEQPHENTDESPGTHGPIFRPSYQYVLQLISDASESDPSRALDTMLHVHRGLLDNDPYTLPSDATLGALELLSHLCVEEGSVDVRAVELAYMLDNHDEHPLPTYWTRWRAETPMGDAKGHREFRDPTHWVVETCLRLGVTRPGVGVELLRQVAELHVSELEELRTPNGRLQLANIITFASHFDPDAALEIADTILHTASVRPEVFGKIATLFLDVFSASEQPVPNEFTESFTSATKGYSKAEAWAAVWGGFRDASFSTGLQDLIEHLELNINESNAAPGFLKVDARLAANSLYSRTQTALEFGERGVAIDFLRAAPHLGVSNKKFLAALDHAHPQLSALTEAGNAFAFAMLQISGVECTLDLSRAIAKAFVSAGKFTYPCGDSREDNVTKTNSYYLLDTARFTLQYSAIEGDAELSERLKHYLDRTS